MKTTHTLLHRINVHIHSFKAETSKVGQLMEVLKAQDEQSVDPEQTCNNSVTKSVHSSQDEGEVD